MFFSKLKLGDLGERLALGYLQRNGYKIIRHRYKKIMGEIDLIASCDNILVFIEVKTRRSDSFGSPEEAVDRRKQKKLIQTALAYIQENGIVDQDFRIDVIGIHIDSKRRTAKLVHLKNAIGEI